MNQNFSTPSSSALYNSYKTSTCSIKRYDNKRRISNIKNINFKLCRKDMTQEILEAENEPIPFKEEDEGNDETTVECMKLEVSTIENSNSVDLGFECLDTPLKNSDMFKVPQIDNQIFSSTPKLSETHKKALIVPSIRVTASAEELIINNECYRVLKQLGKGGSGIVYHCLHVKSNSERAVKIISLSTDMNTIVAYQNEVKLLKQLQNCDRIIKMYDYECFESEKKLMLVLEKGGSDLAQVLKNLTSNNKRLPIHTIVFYWMEMLYAVQEIHKNGIIHADLKPANFLLVECGLRLIDFGIASRIQDNETSVARSCPIGSFNYISPEALTNESSKNIQSPGYGKPKYKIKYKSDVWSLGCIFYQMLYGQTPFGKIQHIYAKICMIIDANHQIDYSKNDWVPQKFVDTIKSCLQYNIKHRPSVDELIKDYENVYM